MGIVAENYNAEVIRRMQKERDEYVDGHVNDLILTLMRHFELEWVEGRKEAVELIKRFLK